MYESPLFLAAHDEDGGGRSVPTTPLQVAAPGQPTPTGPFISPALFLYLSFLLLSNFVVCFSDRLYREHAL